MKRKIFILSASDRYNYGDLLFPIITQKELSKYGDFDFHNIAIVESDLSEYGALPTHKYKYLYNHLNSSHLKPVLLVAGGEVIAANWFKLYGFVYPFYNKIFKFLSNIERAVSKYLPLLKNPLPFVPIDKRIIKNFSIVFHSVGGEKAGPKQLDKKVKRTFDNALYFSVREEKSYKSIKNIYSPTNLKLTPDSAIVMSNFFSFPELKDNQYITFQVGHYKNGGDLNLINSELRTLHLKTGLPIKFVPIGNCPGHDDILSLTWLKANADYPCEVISPSSIEAIMKAIAQSRLFIGTSLHGIITAMSYSIPYVAINPRIPKLKAYIMTWAPDELKFTSDFKSICENSIRALAVDKTKLIENAEMQKELATKSFQTIAELIASQ